MARPYGSLKNKILSYIASHPGATSKEIATYAEVTEKRISTLLWTYAKSNSLRRVWSIDGRGSAYKYYPIAGAEPEREQPKNETSVDTIPLPEVESIAPEPAKTGEEPKSTKSLQSVLDNMVETLASALAEQVLLKLEPILANRIQEVADYATAKFVVRSTPTAAPEPRMVKKKVTVVGLLPKQAGMISSEFHECLDLRFISSDDSIQQLKDSARGADAVLLMTGFVSHGMMEGIRSVNPGGLKLVRGGMSVLRDTLTEIFAAQ